MGGVPSQVQLGGTLPGGGYPAQGVPYLGGTLPGGYPAWGGTLPGGYPAGGGGYPAGGYPAGGVPCPGGYPAGGGTLVGQQKEYSIHGGRYASCVHAGGLSC